ncbi:MAG: tetratricopeptide repeat protein [Thermoanaerobaculum sp.]|nr:tetratricopeptide repeat protein [Thermoanaerobaculum sp.]
MKRLVLVLLVAGAAVGSWGVWSWANRPQWSTKDPETLRAVEHAQGELAKLYYREAAELLEQAAARSPDAFAVRYFLHRAYSGLGRMREAREQLELLKAMDPAQLTPRERMLLELLVLRRSGDREAYLTRLRQYQEEYPREAELARLLALAYQEAGRPDEAERWGRRTLELDPNDALAYNFLGYLELSRGRFAEAYEQFRKYAYIAPDQANPHDSLGELFLITGNLAGAERELTEAVRLYPGFHQAWRHLADLAVLRGDVEGARGAVGKMAEALQLTEEDRAMAEATALGLLGFFHRRPELLAEGAARLTSPKDEWEYFVLHAAALQEGQAPRAEELERTLEAAVASAVPGSRGYARLLPLLQAQRLLAQGRWVEALQAAQRAETANSYVNVGQAWSRLLAQCAAAQALLRLGRLDEARAQLEKVKGVNPAFPGLAWVEGAM